jgi:SAM-dependent methyltransferase
VQPAPNHYSRQWFELFHDTIPASRTAKEVAFICDCLPLPDFRKIADVCCGAGRHSEALARLGYCVTGLDRDAEMITKARNLGGAVTYVEADIRNYAPQAAAFDAVIVMAQSFGHFDSQTNRDVLERLASSVRPGGRAIVDLWSPEFFLAHQDVCELQTCAGLVRETKHVGDQRLYVELEYPNRAKEQFEWELFTESKMNAFAQSVGLLVRACCTEFNLATPPAVTNPRVQFLLERA